MKKILIEATIVVVLVTAVFCLGILIGKNEQKQSNEVVIIWNDDIESMPADGEMVEIQETINDTVYIGNVD